MNNTTQITIRGLDEQTKQGLVERARQKNMSLNAYTLQLLRRASGTSQRPHSNGLAEFFQKNASKKVDEKFEEALRDQRRIYSDKIDWSKLDD